MRWPRSGGVPSLGGHSVTSITDRRFRTLIPWPARRAARAAQRRLARATPRRRLPGGLEPVSASFGHDRGTPIDRVFIGRFLERHRSDVRGRVVELHPADYTHSLGGEHVVTLTVVGVGHDDEPDAIGADLALAGSVPGEAFDCFIFTQALQYVADPATACRNAWQCLAPGGVLPVTAPALSRMDPGNLWPEYWRFTPTGLEHLLEGRLIRSAQKSDLGAGI